MLLGANENKDFCWTMEEGGCDAREIRRLAMGRRFAVELWESWSLFSCGESGRCLAGGRVVVV